MNSGRRTTISFLRSLVLIAAVWAAPAAAAALPKAPEGYVTDGAGVLSVRMEQALEGVIGDLDRKTGVQIAVVTAKSLDGGDIAEAAVRLYKEWGIGKKGRDEGALLLVAPAERRARFEIGYGLEGLIPDARAGRILDERALPRFRAGDMEGGIAAAAMEVVSLVAKDRGVTVGVPPSAPQTPPIPGWLAVLMAIVFGLLVMRHPWLLLLLLSGGRGGHGGGGFGGFGGFGGGRSGGGGASRGW